MAALSNGLFVGLIECFAVVAAVVLHVGRVVAVQLFAPHLHHTVKCASAVFQIFLWRPRMVGRTLLAGK